MNDTTQMIFRILVHHHGCSPFPRGLKYSPQAMSNSPLDPPVSNVVHKVDYIKIEIAESWKQERQESGGNNSTKQTNELL